MVENVAIVFFVYYYITILLGKDLCVLTTYRNRTHYKKEATIEKLQYGSKTKEMNIKV